jgi:CheY-like chemotaxis protein
LKHGSDRRPFQRLYDQLCRSDAKLISFDGARMARTWKFQTLIRIPIRPFSASTREAGFWSLTCTSHRHMPNIQNREDVSECRSGESIPLPEGSAIALAVSPLPTDRIRLREILCPGNWKLHEASDCHEALMLLRDQSVPVLLCERNHADGDWEDLLKATARLPAPPNLIVFSRLADESLWAEVLNLGGFDVLVTPFEPEEVLRVTFAAWSRWECDFVRAPPKNQRSRTA